MRALNLDYIHMFAGERHDLIDSVMVKAESFPASILRKKTFSGWHSNKAKKSPSKHPVDLDRLQEKHREEMALLRKKVSKFSKSTLKLLAPLPADAEIYDLVSFDEKHIIRVFKIQSFMKELTVGGVNEALLTFLAIEGNTVTTKQIDKKFDDPVFRDSVCAALKVIHDDATCTLHPSIVLFLIKRPDAINRVDDYLFSLGMTRAQPLDHGHFEEYLSLESTTLGAGVL